MGACMLLSQSGVPSLLKTLLQSYLPKKKKKKQKKMENQNTNKSNLAIEKNLGLGQVS